MTKQRARTDRGASAVEYGLLIAGIAAVIVAIVFAFGGKIHDAFGNTCNTITNSTGDTSC